MYSVFLFVILIQFSYSTVAEEVIVELPDGKILGTTETSGDGKDYYAFYQVPYAAPPIDDRRFKEPEDPEPWNDVLDGTQTTKICPQGFPTTGRNLMAVEESEDCLYLSVNTPVKPGNGSELPVLLYIHGGAFVAGSIPDYNPKYYMDYDVLVVVIQYRLGPYGFLTTGDGVVPGNLGLKDQRKAINWVHSYIQYFGGDPNKITIMGESAGAISVSYLLLDLSLEGKFRGAVQRSGSSGMKLTLITDPKHYAYELGSQLDNSFGYPNSTQQLLNLLMKSSTEQINNAALSVLLSMWALPLGSVGVMYTVPWALVLEDPQIEKDPIVTAPMLESFQNGNFIKVPTVISFNSEECLANALGFADPQAAGKSYDEDPSLMADDRLEISSENKTAFGSKLIKFYTNFTMEEDYGALTRFSSDAAFINGILIQANLSWVHTPVYIYEFSYAGEVLGTIFFRQTGLNRTSIPGAQTVAHGEDTVYDFDAFYSADDVPDSDLLTRRRFLKILTNFVKHLNGTPEVDAELDNIIWPAVSNYDLEYLNLNNTLEIKSNPRNFKGISEIFNEFVGIKYVW